MTKGFKSLSREQQEQVAKNIVEAVKILYESVKQRKVKEFLEEIKKERKNYGEYQRV